MKRILLLSMVFSFVFALSAWAQRTVSGKVTDEKGEGLPGVNVVIKGTTTGVTTDLDGNFQISVPDDNTVLVFSSVGMATQEQQVGARSVIELSMAVDTKQLQEVVVVGYGDQSKRFTTQQVSQVGQDAIKNVPVLSAQQLLQGAAAGVQMVGTSGVIGSRATVRVRGVASFGGAEPLYVVDGVPLVNTANTSGLGGASLNPLAEINPADIESVSVLKDAAAIAIYGSRGSNGVIIINTKKGSRAQQTKFNADFYTGWTAPTVFRDMMDADQYRTFSARAYNEAYGYGGAVSEADFPQGSFDWPNAVINNGRVNNYSISARGGSENTSFFVSGTYFNQESYILGNAADRINMRMNMEHSATDNLRFGVNIGISRLEYDRINSDNSTFAPATTAYLQTPWTEPRDANGEFVNTGFLANVLAIENLSDYTTINRRTTGNMYAEWDIIEGLTAKSDFGVDMIQAEEFYRDPEVVSPGGYGYKGIQQDNKWLITNTLRYEKEIGSDHRFGVLAGHSYEVANQESIAVEATGFVSDQLPNVGSGATPSTTFAGGSDWAIESYFGRFNYAFKDRYLFEASVRRDGSSRFGANNRYGNFWAVSGGWILSEESFFSGLSSVVNFMKLSTSYGISGNDQIGNFASLGLYGAGTGPDYDGTPGINPTNPANPDLQWEQTSQLDVSLNTSLFESRVNIEASYYVKNTEGILLSVPLPYTTGFASRTQNIGEVRNSGIDLSLNTVNIDNNGLTWETTLNLGTLKNEVISLPDDNQDLDGNNFVTGSAAQRAIQGYTMNQFFLIRYVGVNSETGDAEWLTRDGNITTAPASADRVIGGSAIPTLTGSLLNKVTYKNFDFSVLFTFVSGNRVQLDELRFTDNPNNFDGFNLSTRLLNNWEEAGDNAYMPAFTSATFTRFAQRSTLQNMDGSYIRMRNITLGYTLPSSLMSKSPFDNARVYVMGQNLLTFASDIFDFDADPEINGAGANPLNQGESFFTPPQEKTLTVGVSLSF